MRQLVLIMLVAVAHCADLEDNPTKPEETAAHFVRNIYDNCLKFGSFSCVKPKILGFLSSALNKDRIVLTEDLSIVRNGRPFLQSDHADEASQLLQDFDDEEKTSRLLILDRMDRIENFLRTHELEVKLPNEVLRGDLLPLVPRFLLNNIPQQVTVPLSESKEVAQERGFVKKVLIPFLLGLKFKATALIPLAVALIALKTWKALTLGLLSIVLSGAMVIFKFTKPKVVNYEVYHYPSHPPSPPVVEHPSPYDQHGYGRADGQSLAYKAQKAQNGDSRR